MKDFKRLNNDIAFKNNLFSIIDTDIENTTQRVTLRLKRFSEEWFLNIEKGIDYFNLILVQSPDLIVVEAVFKNEILKEEYLTEILDFQTELDRTGRICSIVFTAKFDDGSTEEIIVEV